MKNFYKFLFFAILSLNCSAVWGEDINLVNIAQTTDWTQSASTYSTAVWRDATVGVCCNFAANNNKGWAYVKMSPGKKSSGEDAAKTGTGHVGTTTATISPTSSLTIHIVANTMSSISSSTLYVYSSYSSSANSWASVYSNQIDAVTIPTSNIAAGNLVITPSSGSTWQSGVYFVLEINMTNSTTSSKGIDIDKIFATTGSTSGGGDDSGDDSGDEGDGNSIIFDFQEDGAHTTNNNYTIEHNYTENNANINCMYFDCVANTDLGTTYNATGRIAKNTTNSPVLTIGPISIANKKITQISYKIKSTNAITLLSQYKVDNGDWVQMFSETGPTTVETKTKDNLSLTGNELTLKFTGSVASSTSSNRDVKIGDITIVYETGSTPPPTPTEYNIELTTDPEDAATITATVDGKSVVKAAAGETVTLSYSNVVDGFVFTGWYVLDGNAEEITVTNNSFEMPGSDVTVQASFDIPTPPAPETKRIYMVSGFADWSNAKYAVYDVTHGTWLDHFMTEDVCSGGYYDDIPTDCATVVFGRFNTAKQSQPAGDWNTGAVDMWNQSVNVVWGENNLFTTKGYGTYGDDNGKAYGDLSTFALPTYTVTLAKNPNNYGSISPTSIDAVPCGTNISASGNKLNVGNTTVTATPKDATAQYTYAFDTWSWTDNVTSVESNITATANFSRVVNSYTVGEITLNDCSITSGTWPTGTFEYGYEFDLTIAAPAGYRLNKTLTTSGCSASWTPDLEENATSGTVHVKITGANSSLTIGKTALTYTVTWMANGVQHDSKSNISYNATLTMPSTNPEPCDAFHHFMGWTATENYTEATAPGDLFLSAGDKKVTANTTYYAVYGQIGEFIDGGGEEELKATLDLTDNTNWGFPEGSANKANDEASFTSGDYTIKVKGDGVFNAQGDIANGYYWHTTSKYLALGKSGAQITLPTFNFAVSKITVTGKGGASASVKQNIYVGETAVSTETTGAATATSQGVTSTAITNEYVINESYRAVGTEYIFKVTSAHNTQVTTIGIYGSGSSISYSSYSTICSNPTWTVTFDNQGHGAQVAPITNVEHNTAITAPTAPVATGWAFGGWYKEAACTNAWDFANDKVTGNITLYAKWNCGWKVAYNQGEAQDQTNNLAYNSETHEMTTTLHLDGNTTYYFHFTDGNWFCGLHDYSAMTKNNNGPETKWQFQLSTEGYYSQNAGLITTATGDYTFHVVEEVHDTYLLLHAYVTYPASVAVTFNKQGKGDNEILYTAPNTALVTLPTNPEALSFRFDGWYNDQECTSPWSSTELIAADKTVYAKWTELRTTLYLNAGVWKTEGAGEKFAVYYFTNDEQHKGWSEFMTPYECDDAIYITTIPQGYDKVNFVRLKNTCVTPDWEDKWNQTSDKALADSWNKCSITSFGETNSDSPATYELYSAPQNHITFNDNGADGGEVMAMIDLDCGNDVTLPSMTRTKEHYTFEGWKDANNNEYADGATIENVTNDIALTAQWVAIPQYTITFHVPECAATPSAITKYKDEVIDLGEIAEPTINNADYTFVGWSRIEQTTADVACPTIETSIIFSEDVNLYAIYSVGSEQPTGEFKLSANISGTEYYAQALANGKKYLGATTSEANGYIFGLEDGEYLYYKNGETRTYVYYPNNSTDIAVVSSKNENNYNKWTLEVVEGNTITLKNKGGNRYLGGSISSSIARFAAYSSEYRLTRHDIMAGQTEYTSAPVCTPELSDITVDASGATKTTYRQNVDNTLITEGIVVTAHYNYSSETQEVDLSDCQFSGQDFTTAGNQTITVTYQGFTDTYTITITPTYTVTYIGGEGATNVPSDNTRYDEGDNVTVLGPGSMGKPDNMFQYWVYNEMQYNGGEKITMPASNITFTAQWVAAITVTLHYEGYTTDCDQLMSGPQGSTIILPAGKIVVGKTFDGWSDGVNIYHAGDEYTLTESTTLTATYTNWTISYNYNGTIVSGVEVPETGVVIPTVAEGTAVDNNIFIGFTKTQDYSATDLPADFIAAGSVYTPATGGEILYALYRQGDAEYKLIKDIKDLRLGAHVVLASIDEDYAMGNTFIKGQDTLPAIVVTKDGDEETITFGNEVQEWVLTTSSQAGSSAEYQGIWVFNRSDDKKLASSNTVGKVTLGTNVTTGSSFRIAIDASGRAMVQCVANYNISTLSMGDNGAFGCYNPNTIDAPDLAIYQHIGTKYVTTPTAVYRVKSVDMVNGRIDKNDYYAAGESIDLSGYANDGYSTSNRYLVLGETNRDTISKIKTFTMPAYNVIDTLTNRAKQDTIVFVVPECVSTPATQRVDWNSVIELPEVANVNAWNFVGWVRTAINDTTENHTEIFTSYTVPHVDRDTFYAIYSYDGLETNGFVLSTVNGETTYYLGEYVPGSANRYFSAVTDKAQALVLYNEDDKLYYHSADTLAYLQANAQGTSSVTYNLLTTNRAGATVWTINKDEATNEIAISTTINESTRYLRFNSTYSRYNIYTDRQNPVWEKAPSYTTNPVCAQYAYYFTSDEEENEPEYVYELGQDGKVIPYSPANECGAKRFMGWSETKVTALQQSAPSMVAVATQIYDRDVNLYAVYAAPNGGKVVDTPTITDDVTAMGAFKTTQDSGMTSLNTRYYFHNAKYWSNNNSMRMTKGKDADSSYITTSLIRDLEKIQVVYANTKPLVYISEDNEEWTEISLTKEKEGTNYFATPETPGDYYVAFSIIRSSAASSSYSDVQAVTYTHNKAYWYSDYSTNCTTVASATMSFQNQEATTVHDPIAAETIGQVITLPTLKVAGQHFDHWTINDVEYEGGESYKLSHDVTAIATMSEAQLVCSPETLFVTSAKGKTVRSTQTIHITCPDITEGTLETPADIDQANGKLHFILDNATATDAGLNATLRVEYTAKTATSMSVQKVTLTIGSISTTVNVRATCLPEQFVIAHQGQDERWYALPADITAYGTMAGYEITVDGANVTAPKTALYQLDVVNDNPQYIRFKATDTTALMTHTTADNINIKVGKVADDETGLSQWYIQSADNESFVIKNVAKNGKNLIFNSLNKFGMFANGDTLFRIFKVANEVAVINLEVTQWETNGFTFLPSISIPTHDAFSLTVNEAPVDGATCTARYELYDVRYNSSIDARQSLQLQWFNKGSLVATGTVVTPARVTSNTTLSELIGDADAKTLDVVVTSGTLTVDAKATIHNLDICAGATVAIVNDTLTTNTLTFRGGLTDPTNGYAYEVPRLYIQKNECTTAPGYIKPAARVYYYLNVNSNNYYPFTVPYKAAIQNIHYASKPNTNIQSIYGNAIIISKYDGESRGANKPKDNQKYWKDLSYSNDLIPGVGYIITAKKQKNDTYATLRILMMVSDMDATTDTVAVGAWGVGPESTTAWYNQGWNYIANPYTAMLAGTDADEEHHSIQSGTEVRYATIPTPTIDGYDQVPMNEADLKPFYGFFIQASETGNYNFVKENRHQAPAYLLAEQAPEQEAYIQLSGEGMSDVFGLIAGNRYSDRYEINADLTKELGTANDLRAWLMSDETKMAYLAVNDETARTLIPLNLRTPAEGEYTFSLRKTSKVDDLEGLYLYDYQTGAVTNLILSDYSFTAPPGGVVDRFALSAIRMPKAPTDMNKLQEKENRMVVLKDGHIYILVNEAMYTAEGKEVTK